MKIKEAFEIQKRQIVTLVGGGGKTTTMLTLAGELSEEDMGVIVTTTTKIFRSEGKKTDHLLFLRDEKKIKERISRSLQNNRVLTIASNQAEKKKLSGIKPEFVERIAEINEVELTIVEGDGAARKPFKAPAKHEPVIPQCTDLVIPIVGVDVIGKPLNDDHVHRAEIVTQLTDIEIGDLITPEVVAEVLTSEKGGLKNIPNSSKVIPLVNKIECEKDNKNAEAIADNLKNLAKERIKRVVLGHVQSKDPILSVLC